MDGTTFDNLIKRLATTPLSRSKALRGLAASAAALVGVTLGAEPSVAKKKRTICHCTNETAASCKTIKIGRKAAKRHVKKHACDYKGECQNRSDCCFVDTLTCTSDAQCCSGFCREGTCRPTDCASLGESCVSLTCCSVPIVTCQSGTCAPCKTDGAFCGVDSECCSGDCNVTCQ